MKRHGESERQQSTEIGTFPGVCFGKEAVSDPCIASKWVFFLVDNVLLLCFALHCFLSEVGVLHCKSSVVISYSCPEGTVRLCFGCQFFGGQSTLLILLEPWLHRFRR